MVNEWINQNYENIKKWLYNVTKGERPDLFEDFIQEVILIFLEHPKARDMVIQGDVRWFIVRVALNQWRSSTSPFHKQYRPNHTELLIDLPLIEEEYDYEIDIIEDLVIQILDEMHMGTLEEYYQSLVVLIYLDLNKNFSLMERKLGIPRTSLSRVYNEAIKNIKETLSIKIEQIKNGNLRINGDINNVYSRWNLLRGRAMVKTGAVHAEAVKAGFFKSI